MENQFLNIVRRETTLRERSAFFEELQHNPDKKREFLAFQKMWIVNNIAHKRVSQKSKGSHFHEFWKIRQPSIIIGKWKMVMAVAAVAFFVLLLSAVLFVNFVKPSENQFVLEAPKGNITNITLEDGSKLWLNSSSRARITNYGDEKTVVDLEGEAFFDVVHNEKRDFLVKVGDYYIVDKGTTFNVKFCEEEQILVTSLFEGAINFCASGKSIIKKMEPGKEFSFDLKNKKLTFSKTDEEFVTAWKEGKFVFVNRSLEEICEELEEWYDVQFVFKNELMKTEKFSGVIKRKTSIEHLLRVLQISSRSDYRMEEMENGKLQVIFE